MENNHYSYDFHSFINGFPLFDTHECNDFANKMYGWRINPVISEPELCGDKERQE